MSKGSVMLNLSEVSKRRRNIASLAASVRAIYSDSIEERATVICL